jgi:hypothetical protein
MIGFYAATRVHEASLLFALIREFVAEAFGPISVRQAAGDEHVSPVKSKELDQLVEPTPVAICSEDECRLDTFGVLVAERILR